MNMYAAFCRAIEDGLFDEVKAMAKNGTQRLVDATEPFVIEGTLSRELRQELLERLDDRRVKMTELHPG